MARRQKHHSENVGQPLESTCFDSELNNSDAHVWVVPTRSSASLTERFYSLLSPEEIHRVRRFHNQQLKRTFILAHGALRILLGNYTNTDAREIQLTYGPQGKPRVDAEPLDFNISHSGDIALLAFTRGCELGIDIEQVRPLPEMYDIARNFFTPEETEELLLLPIEQRQRAFYRCWTRKEACIKAHGGGLSIPLNSFRVTLAPDISAKFVSLERNGRGTTPLTLVDLTISPEFVAALAYQGIERHLRITSLTDPCELEFLL